MSEEDRVLVTRTIPVARERVFEAWLDPEMLRRFMCPAPGVELGHVAVDPAIRCRALPIGPLNGRGLRRRAPNETPGTPPESPPIGHRRDLGNALVEEEPEASEEPVQIAEGELLPSLSQGV